MGRTALAFFCSIFVRCAKTMSYSFFKPSSDMESQTSPPNSHAQIANLLFFQSARSGAQIFALRKSPNWTSWILFFSSWALTGNISTSGAWALVECFPLVLSQGSQIQPVYGYFNSLLDYITHLEVGARANIKCDHVSAASLFSPCILPPLPSPQLPGC